LMVGRMGYMVSTGGEGQLGLFQQREIDYWTPNNTDAKWQKPILSTSGGDSYSSLLGFQNASFLKMRNISLGYFVSSTVCKKVGIRSAKLYVQAQNPFTVYSTVDWLDLDLGGSTFNRSWVLGINIGF
jgi:TonB-dependent starch-binding outer membrane protein SusC